MIEQPPALDETPYTVCCSLHLSRDYAKFPQIQHTIVRKTHLNDACGQDTYPKDIIAVRFNVLLPKVEFQIHHHCSCQHTTITAASS